MINFIINIIIGMGWAIVFLTIIPYLVILVITLFKKERDPEVVKYLKLYLLLPITLFLITFVRAFITANFYRPDPVDLESYDAIETEIENDEVDGGGGGEWVPF